MEPVEKRKIAAIMIMVALFVGASIWWQESKRPPRQVIAQTPQTVDSALEKQKVTVSISGAVAKPGLYRLEPNRRVVDLVEQAGGLLPEAEQDKLNMARRCYDGMHVEVKYKKVVLPKKSPVAREPLAAGRAQANDKIISLNSASEQDLALLPGIGPALAKRIVDYRQRNGAFTSIEQIMDVSGIGESKFEQLKPRISL